MENKLEPTVGAWVHITNRFNERVAKIDRITKTQFIVGDTRFRLADGYMVGGNIWHLTLAVVITEEQANELKAQFDLKRKADEVKIFVENSVKSLSSENAIKVAEYIKSLEK